jgi:hypothetical protein
MVFVTFLGWLGVVIEGGEAQSFFLGAVLYTVVMLTIYGFLNLLKRGGLK